MVVQWIRICLPMWRTQLQSLVREGPTCLGATKAMHCSYRSPRAPEPVLYNQRIHLSEKLCTATGKQALFRDFRKPLGSNRGPVQPKINK